MTALLGKLRDFANWNDPSTFPDDVRLQGTAGTLLRRSADIAPLFADLDVSDPVIADLDVLVSLHGKDYGSVPADRVNDEDFLDSLQDVDILTVMINKRQVTGFHLGLDGARSRSKGWDTMKRKERDHNVEGVKTVAQLVTLHADVIDHFVRKAA